MTILMAIGLVLACLEQAALATVACPGGTCEAVTAGALLQRSSWRAVRQGPSHLGTDLLSNPADVLSLVTNLSEKVVKSQYKLSVAEADLLWDINLTIENSTIPGILKEHEQQQQMIDEAHDELTDCRNTSEMRQADLGHLTADMRSRGVNHSACRANESELVKAKDKAWGELKAWVAVNVSIASLSFPFSHQVASPDSDMMEAVEAGPGYFSSAIASMESALANVKGKSSTFWRLWGHFKNATADHVASQSKCNLLQQQYESGYCEWHEFGTATEAQTAGCNGQILGIENATKHFNASQQARKAMWAAARRIQCFLKIILHKKAEERMVEECAKNPISTLHLDLDIRDNVQEIMRHMNTSSGYNFVWMPGQPSWRKRHYANLSADAPRKNTTACLHSIKCADFTCTGGYKLNEAVSDLVPDFVSIAQCCVCDPGFQGNGSHCNDVDECSLALDNCDVKATCTNTEGSFDCACEQGFAGNGTHCQDVDECAGHLHVCNANAHCNNTFGSFSCACKPGFEGNGIDCKDIDECSAILHNCAAHATCSNTNGSFECTCRPGFIGDGVACQDQDECAEGLHECHVHATCTNSNGSHDCSCNPGFEGDGKDCLDVDECSLGTDNCHAHATCSNTAGSFQCACVAGYSGNGATCADVDECAAGLHNCDGNAACSNSDGSFSCTCNAGFQGDGVACAAITTTTTTMQLEAVADAKYCLYVNDLCLVWASPCSGYCSQVEVPQHPSWCPGGVRYATQAEWDAAHSTLEDNRDDFYAKCAAESLDPSWNHCDSFDPLVRYPDNSYNELVLVCD